MTRKRSAYRPRPVLRNPVAYVLEGFAPATDYPKVALDARIKNHVAFESLIDGGATPRELDILALACNMAMALSRKHGADWKAELVAAANAIEAIQKRLSRWRKLQATDGELAAIEMLLRIHDAQVDSARVLDIEEAAAIVRSKTR